MRKAKHATQFAGLAEVENAMTSHRVGDMSRMFAASIVTGLMVGVLGSLFRAALEAASRWRDQAIAHLHATPVEGALVTIAAVAIAAMLARWLVARFAPIAAGSGVQHVEAVMRGESRPAGMAAVPVKFFGGLLAIGAGLPLGREGPTVQMGAVVGNAVAARMLRDPANRPSVAAAGAGAGLAVAFNTPVGGAVFVFEELTRSFVARQMLTALAAATVAMLVMRLTLGDTQLFSAGVSSEQPLAQLPFHFLLGAALGLVGAGYAWLTTAFLDAADRMRRVPSELRAAAIGLAVGAVGWFAPSLIGGGETLTQTILTAAPASSALLLILAVRIVLGPLAYAAGVPGGLFAPLLAIGAAFGALAAGVAGTLPFNIVPSFLVCGVVGMAAMFAAVVRAPLTGIVMAIEMTGRADCALPMLTACLAAVMFSTLAGSRPIYDVLRERMLAAG